MNAGLSSQGKDSWFYSLNLALRKTLSYGRLISTLQSQNIDMRFLKTNEQFVTK